jgi:hypothetical protein
VPRPAGTGVSPWLCSDDVDEALHHEEEDGKKQTSTSTTTADSDQDDDDDDDGEWVPSSRHQHWQHPIPASIRSSNGSYVIDDEANEDQHESEYQHVQRQREIEGTDHADSNRSGGNGQPVDARVIVMHRSDNSRSHHNHPTDSSDSDNDTHRWSCPRCTLQNPAATSKCVACNFKQTTTTATTTTSTAIRPQDPVRRERLVPHQQQQQQRNRYRFTNNHHRRLLTDLERELVQSNSNSDTTGASTSARSIANRAAAVSTFAPSFQPQQSQSQSQSHQGLYHTAAHFIFSGALVGGVLGLAGAYLQGENSYVYMYPYSYAGITSCSTFWAILLEVTLSGAIAGAVVHNVWERERAIKRDRLGSSNSNSRSQDTDDPTVAFIMQSMETSSRLSSSQMTQAMGVDGNGGSGSMTSYDYFLNSTVSGSGGGNGGSGTNENENARAAVEQDIHSLPTMQVQDTDPDKLPEDCRRCAICLDAFLPGSFRKTLPCWHGFHTQCVDKWLRNVGACPICKHRID